MRWGPSRPRIKGDSLSAVTDSDSYRTGTVTPARAAVGVPIHEVVLHELLAKNHFTVLRPGSGRKTYFLAEPELAFGRPDAIVLSMSPNALLKFRTRGLRIPTLASAQCLASEGTNVSKSHAHRLTREMRTMGWNPDLLRVAADLVVDAIAIEAKVSDWRRGIRQATTYRVGVGRSALLVPQRIEHLVSESNLIAHEVGLLVERGSRIAWVRQAPPTHTMTSQRAWLVELLLRQLDSDSLSNNVLLE